MTYAVVRRNKVDNIIECDGLAAQPLEKVMKCLLVPVGQYPVAVGDEYTDGVFTRNGAPVERVATDAERVAALEAENAALRQRLAATEEATLGLMTEMLGV